MAVATAVEVMKEARRPWVGNAGLTGGYLPVSLLLGGLRHSGQVGRGNLSTTV